MTAIGSNRVISKWLRVAHMIAATSRNRLRFARGDIRGTGGSTHTNRQVSESLGYIRRVFEDYRCFGRLQDRWIEGKSVLELGPGDNVGVGLLFLADGAKRVVCLDKFYSVHSIEYEREVYIELRKQLDPDQQRRFDAAVQLDGGLVFNSEKLEYVYGQGAGEADKALSGQIFDLILSRAVLEEVYDTDSAFAAMNRLLAAGGMLLHKIDLTDYGTFSGLGLHPLEFLTVPDPIYRLMSNDNGRPNRRMMDYYRDKMLELGLESEIYITEVLETNNVCHAVSGRKVAIDFGVDYFDRHRALVRAIRPRLLPRFRHLPDQELLAAGVFLAATKPVSA